MSDLYMDAHRFLTDDQIKERDEAFKKMQEEWYEKTYGEKFVYEKRGETENKNACLQNDVIKAPTNEGGVAKIAPVQGYSAGIPWDMHMRAYDAYCKKYGRQNALIDLEGRNCRGGFGVSELDRFIPNWRKELDERNKLQQALSEKDKRIAELEGALEIIQQECQVKTEHKDDWVRKFCGELAREALKTEDTQ